MPAPAMMERRFTPIMVIASISMPPALYVKSAWHTDDHVNNSISHSPLAAAHVAGAAAVIRGLDSSCDVEQVNEKRIQYSHSEVLANVPNNTSNLLFGVPTAADGEVSCAPTDWLGFFHLHNQLLALTDINQ